MRVKKNKKILCVWAWVLVVLFFGWIRFFDNRDGLWIHLVRMALITVLPGLFLCDQRCALVAF